MRQLRLAAIIVPALLLTACGGGNPPAPAQPSTQPDVPAPPAVVQSTTPAKDADIKPVFGTWGLDPANCSDQVLTISKKQFAGPGSACGVTGWSDNGNGSYTAAMSCKASGQTSNERVQMRPIFTPTGEGIDLVYLDRNNLQTEVLRCDATN